MAKFAPETHQKLLGHQSNCLSAPAEVSTWTKFCEIDLPRAVELENQELESEAEAEADEAEASNEIPYELAQFEIHLRQPVKIHNIRKRMQQEQQALSKQGTMQNFGLNLHSNSRLIIIIIFFLCNILKNKTFFSKTS